MLLLNDDNLFILRDLIQDTCKKELTRGLLFLVYFIRLMMCALHELYRQAFRLFALYDEGKLSKGEYLDAMKPIDSEIAKLEMKKFSSFHASKKAS